MICEGEYDGNKATADKHAKLDDFGTQCNDTFNITDAGRSWSW